MDPFFTDDAKQALNGAAAAAGQRNQRTVEPRHFLLSLVKDLPPSLREVLARLGADPERLREAVARSLPRTRTEHPPARPPDLPYTDRAQRVMEAARRQARADSRSRVRPSDLLLALTAEKGITRTLLEEFGIEERKVRAALDAPADDGEEEKEEEKKDSTPAFRQSVEEDSSPPLPAPPRERRPAFRDTLERRSASEDREVADDGVTGDERGPGRREEEASPAKDAGTGKPPRESSGVSSGEPREDTENTEASGTAVSELLRPDATDDAPLYEQIVRRAREGVATGRLEPGERLPSVRSLADLLSVSAGTTAKAYRELERLGIVATRGRRGTYVTDATEDPPPRDERIRRLAERLHAPVVDAYHLGADPDDLREALEKAMRGIFE